jgi:hypothetical protein
MSKERLQEIKENEFFTWYPDVQWLISEVERLQAENEQINHIKTEFKKLEMMLWESQQKVERLEKAVEGYELAYDTILSVKQKSLNIYKDMTKEFTSPHDNEETLMDFIEFHVKQALETEGEEPTDE